MMVSLPQAQRPPVLPAPLWAWAGGGAGTVVQSIIYSVTSRSVPRRFKLFHQVPRKQYFSSHWKSIGVCACVCVRGIGVCNGI